MSFYHVLFAKKHGFNPRLTWYENLFALIGGIASFIAKVLKIKGNTIVWNQQVDASTSSVTLTSGHKFVTKVNGTYSVVSGTGQSLAVTGGTDEVFDITKMLGSTLADSIYSMEQSQSGSGVAYFRKLFPLDYYSYESGKLLNFNGEGAKGKNLLDESVGVPYSSGKGIRWYQSDGFTLKANKPYTMSASNTGGSVIAVYFLEKASNNVLANGNGSVTYTPTSDVVVYFQAYRGGGIPEGTHFQVEQGSSASSYEPYTSNVSIQTVNADQTETSIKQLPISTYFPNGMKSAGSVFDELTPTKAIKRVGSVDLGTLTWTYYANYQLFLCTLPNWVNGDARVIANLLTANYETDIYNSLTADLTLDKKIASRAGNTNGICIRDLSTTDATAFTNSLSGQILNFELDTEVETAITENLNYKVYSGGTETLLPIDDISTSPFSANIDYPSGNEDVYFTIKESGIYE